MKTGGRVRTERRLAAILAADVAGYSRLIGADEEGTLRRLRSVRAEVIDPKIAEHQGRLVKTTGDGLLAEFGSVVDALRCATEVQREMARRNLKTAETERMEYRIGIHQGDIVVEDADILGDGVNVAARLEALADPGGICVSARVQEDAAGRLDLSFDDLGEQMLKNIARPIRAYGVRIGDRSPLPTLSSPPIPDKPSIAVLPFQNMSGDPEQEYFADGMVEEIITALSRIRWLFVIARNSSFTYKGQAIDVKRVGRELGVRYLLEGSVRKAGGRVRITTQLIDAGTGSHLWADRFEGSLEEIFKLQDDVAVSVAGIIEPTLQAAETRRSAERQTPDVTAYEFYLRALGVFFPVTKEGVVDALGLLEQAIAIDLRYGPALAWAAICCMRLADDGWVQDLETYRRRAKEFAQRALQVAQNDPRIIANAAFVLGRYGEDVSAMIGLVDRALSLNPSYARGWFVSGLLRTWIGQHDLGIEHLETSTRLSPRDPTGTPLQVIGGAYFFKHEYEKAVAKLLLAIQDNPKAPPAYRTLAACYAHMGRLDDARAIIAKLRTITARVVPSNEDYLPWRRRDTELFLSGLRRAVDETT